MASLVPAVKTVLGVIAFCSLLALVVEDWNSQTNEELETRLALIGEQFDGIEKGWFDYCTQEELKEETEELVDNVLTIIQVLEARQ
jgi:hypothetical protein